MAQARRRLGKELGNIAKEENPALAVKPKGEEDLFHWEAVIQGPQGTPYEGGKFKLDIEIPQEYPFKAPTMRFLTKIYHPSVKTDDGSICGDIFTDWKPAIQIIDVLKDIMALLACPDPDKSPLEPAIASQMKEDHAQFVKQAKDFTKQYAM